MRDPTDLIRRLADEVEADPSIIYLEPYPGSPDGRMWCEDPVWDEIPECGGQSVRYVREDLMREPDGWVAVDTDPGGRLMHGSRIYDRDEAERLFGGSIAPVYIGPAVEVGDHA